MIAGRVAGLDWPAIASDLDARGVASVDSLLSASECRAIASLYERDEGFRSRGAMARHGFGRGEYRYFAYPLPALVEEIRTNLYPHLARIANRWNAMMKLKTRYPAGHAQYLSHCHVAGQTRPTPLVLRYETGDYNCLHQDVYGDHLFPLQATVLLSHPGKDFDGGEFVLTEQRPRMQSRADMVPLAQGSVAIFASRERPVRGTRGIYRVVHRHGVSRLRSGRRYALGIIFHDAE